MFKLDGMHERGRYSIVGLVQKLFCSVDLCCDLHEVGQTQGEVEYGQNAINELS